MPMRLLTADDAGQINAKIVSSPQRADLSNLLAALVVGTGLAWRIWLAHATFFNTDEAWHYSLGNRDSIWLAYRASLTINHPPLLILLLHFWREVGTSNLVLRLPNVIAGAIFCWVFYRWLALLAGRAAAWVGLILTTFLPPTIAMSADLRQYPLLLLFAVAAAYFLERALAENSGPMMLASSLSLYMAMLSHYSAFFIATALGAYSILRMLARRPPTRVLLAWACGQVVGVGLAAFLYSTHISRLSSLVTQSILPQQYLSEWYFHKGKDHLLPFLYRGTFGIFRFAFGQTQVGQFAAVLFLIGVIFLFVGKGPRPGRSRDRAIGILLLLPFVLNGLAVAAGLYPYGRMRQCVYLAIFGIAGVSFCVARIARGRASIAAAIAVAAVFLCQAFGTPQDRDAIPLAEQRHQHMDAALQFLRAEVLSSDVIFTDQATSFQLRHYLCQQKPVRIEVSPQGLEEFRCEGFHVVFTGPNEGALTAENVADRSRAVVAALSPTNQVWVVQAGWASGLGEALRQFPVSRALDVHSFGRYIEVFRLPH